MESESVKTKAAFEKKKAKGEEAAFGEELMSKLDPALQDRFDKILISGVTVPLALLFSVVLEYLPAN